MEAISDYNVGASEFDPEKGCPVVTQQLQSYWNQRRSNLLQRIAHTQETVAFHRNNTAWEDYCDVSRYKSWELESKTYRWIDRYLKCCLDRIAEALRDEWKIRIFNRDIASLGKQFFAEGAWVELLFPYQLNPLSVHCLPGPDGSLYGQRTLSNITDRHIEIGKPVLGVGWRNVFPMCLIFPNQDLPDQDYLRVEDFHVEKDGKIWKENGAIANVFGYRAELFRDELKRAAEVYELFTARNTSQNYLSTLQGELSSLDKMISAWRQVFIPEAQVMELVKQAELFQAGDPAAPHGLLLYGPPGTGKTLVARSLADSVNCDFQYLTLADIKSPNLGQSAANVRQIWNRARSSNRSILFLDECEGLLGRRGAAETDVVSAEIVQTFLAEWQNNGRNMHVWVIGATNRRDMLDDAIRSRFGWEMEIAAPGPQDRVRILGRELQLLGVNVPIPSVMEELTQGMSGRNLQQLAKKIRTNSHPNVPRDQDFLEAAGTQRKAQNIRVDPKATWDTLVLDEAILDRLKMICTLLRNTEAWRAQGISIPKSLLLSGPPGTGKTQIGRTLANESGLTFIAASTADVKANFLGQSGNRVKQLFERARLSAPVILFLDELDIIAPDRMFSGGDALTDEIVGQLLQEMDGIQADDRQVFLLAATNNASHIDAAILSRMLEKIEIPFPDRAARRRLFRQFLEKKKIGFSLEDGTTLLADLTEGCAMSGRDLGGLVEKAEQRALLRAMREGGPGKYNITLDDFDIPERTAVAS